MAIKPTKSFQNCLEAEVPGYNDCPTVLFSIDPNSGPKSKSKTRAKTKRCMSWKLTTEVMDLYGNTKTATTPPPVSKRPPVGPTQQEPASEIVPAMGQNDTQSQVVMYSKDDLLLKINDLCGPGSKLASKEQDFYKRKIDSNIAKILHTDHTRMVLSQIFDENDKQAAVKTIKHWMVTDTTISNWCPAFLKLFENSAQRN